MTMSKDEIREVLASAEKRSFTTLDAGIKNVHLFIGGKGDDLDRMVEEAKEKALRKGEMLLHSDGSHEFRATYADCEGGEYVWAEDGERVRCTHNRVITKDGVRTETPIRTVWKRYENV